MGQKCILPEAVAAKYKAKTNNCRFDTASGLVDLRTLTLEEADRLFESGFPFLVPIKRKAGTEQKTEK